MIFLKETDPYYLKDIKRAKILSSVNSEKFSQVIPHNEKYLIR